MHELRVPWLLKAVLPVAAVLVSGVLGFVWLTLSLDDAERRGVLAVAVGGAIIICAVLLLVLGILVQRPLLELQKKIAQLRSGDLTVATSFADRDDEIGELGRNFNETVEQLRDSQAAMRRAHQVEMSRAEHLATLGELAAGLAHEIRNPLAGIAGAVEMLGQELPPSSPSQEIWRDVKQEIQQIQKILNELLEYARPRPPQFHLADLNETVEQSVKLAQRQLASKPVRMEFRKTSGPLAVEHDTSQIQQVMLNLLLNAAQAIQGAGEIRVSLEADREHAFVNVWDTGSGIDPAHLPNIFRPFFTTKGKGTGLGLSLAQRIAEGHGGGIDVESTLEKGSRFTLVLPLKAGAALSAAQARHVHG